MNLLAQRLTNPAVPAVDKAITGAADSGQAGANVLASYIAVLIQTSLVLGGMAVLLYMFMGAIGWITAGGDSGKIEKARDRIIQSIIGLAILASVTALAVFIGPVFGIDLLSPTFVNQLTGGAGSLGTGAAGSMLKSVPVKTP